MKRIVICSGLFIVLFVNLPNAAENRAGEWRETFNVLCSRTTDSMSLSVEELNSLVADCADVSGELEKVDQPERRILQKRLSLACNLYKFVLENKIAEAGSGEE